MIKLPIDLPKRVNSKEILLKIGRFTLFLVTRHDFITKETTAQYFAKIDQDTIFTTTDFDVLKEFIEAKTEIEIGLIGGRKGRATGKIKEMLEK